MMRIGLRLAVTLACTAVAAAAQAANGQKLYDDTCAACHQKSGLGAAGEAPALKGGKMVQGDPQVVAAVMLFGRGGMPAFKDGLTDAALADIMTYVRSAWGNRAKAMTPAQFAAARKAPRPRRPQVR